MSRELTEVQNIINSYQRNINRINATYEMKDKETTNELVERNILETRLDTLEKELSNIDSLGIEELNSFIDEEGRKPIGKSSLKSEYEENIQEVQKQLDQKKSVLEIANERKEAEQERKQQIFDAENKIRKELTMKKIELQSAIEENQTALEINQLEVARVAIEIRSFKHEYKDGKDINEQQYKKLISEHKSLVAKGNSLQQKSKLYKSEIELCDKVLQKFHERENRKVQRINNILKRDTITKDTVKKEEKAKPNQTKAQKPKDEKQTDMPSANEKTTEKQKPKSKTKGLGDIANKQSGRIEGLEFGVPIEENKEKSNESKNINETSKASSDETVKKEKDNESKIINETNTVSPGGTTTEHNKEKSDETDKVSPGGATTEQKDKTIEDYMNRLWNIKINEKNGTINVIDDNNNEKTFKISEALEERKTKFKRLGIKNICREIAGGKLRGFRLYRKIDPTIIKAIEGNKDLINSYIEAIHQKDEFPFYLKHDLTGLTRFEKFRLNKYIKMEEKSGAIIIGKLFDKKRTLEASKDKTKTDIPNEDIEIIEDFSSEEQAKGKQTQSPFMEELLNTKNVDKSVKIYEEIKKEQGEEKAKEIWRQMLFNDVSYAKYNKTGTYKDIQEEIASNVQKIQKEQPKQKTGQEIVEDVEKTLEEIAKQKEIEEAVKEAEKLESTQQKSVEYPILEKLFDKSPNLSPAEKFAISGYASVYGENAAIKEYAEKLQGSKLQLDIMNMKENSKQKKSEQTKKETTKTKTQQAKNSQEDTKTQQAKNSQEDKAKNKEKKQKTDFVEKVNNEDGRIEKKAAENVKKQKDGPERVEGEIVSPGDKEYKKFPKKVDVLINASDRDYREL